MYGLVGDAEGRVAIVRASDGVFLPGGGVEAGESAEAALTREALEECGWTIRVGPLLARAVQFTPAFEKPSEFYSLQILSESGGGHEPGHTTLWLPPEGAANRVMHESHAWALRQFTARDAGAGSPPVARPARRIVAFHQDDQGHWVADLECGHAQHVRHDPPWQLRPWVLTPEGRANYLGVVLGCSSCATPAQT